MADVPMLLRIISPISNLAGGSKKDGKRTSGVKEASYKRGGKVKRSKRSKGRSKGR